jgi:Tripartite tricarboxylate transporter family receptor
MCWGWLQPGKRRKHAARRKQWRGAPRLDRGAKFLGRISTTLISEALPALARPSEEEQAPDAQPGRLNWATTTGYSDFLFAAFLKNTGLAMSKVPYRDTVQASSDLAQGRIQMYWGALAIVRPQVQAGKARLLAISNGVPAPDEPEVRPLSRPASRRCCSMVLSASSDYAIWRMMFASVSLPMFGS